jgi:hypothetical protein
VGFTTDPEPSAGASPCVAGFFKVGRCEAGSLSGLAASAGVGPLPLSTVTGGDAAAGGAAVVVVPQHEGDE